MAETHPLRPVRGMRDLLPGDARLQHFVVENARDCAERAGFYSVETPILEASSLFLRSLGQESDIVLKEMYRFTDQGGEDITMRPENTASILRALMSNRLHQNLPQKLFYAGPMFRRERPQKGRFRQFHQCGIESIGSYAPFADIDVIACAVDVLDSLDIRAPVVLELNTLGDADSRRRWSDALRVYFSRHKDSLDAQTGRKIESSVLTILDSKDETVCALKTEAPKIDDFLSKPAGAFFDTLCQGLEALKIPYKRNPSLVRGLDYYSHTVFEFTVPHSGSQSTILAGGRYDGLSELLGGAPMGAVGWAAGVERLCLLHAPLPPVGTLFAALSDVKEDAMRHAFFSEIVKLRRRGIAVSVLFEGTLKKQMKQADRIGAEMALLWSEESSKNRQVVVRDMKTGSQNTVALDELVSFLSRESKNKGDQS